jgi:CRP/FNR family cyclic AMP-dependent transcriptional regulator
VESVNKLEHLRTTDLFQDLSEEELAALEQRMPHAVIEAGRPIYSPQEQGEVLFILKKGRVRLYRLSPDGKTLTTAILEPGAVFGEMALLGQGMHESFAEALEDCTISTLRRQDVQEVLLDDPRVAWRLLELIGRRLVQVERKLGDFAFKSVPERLASLLLQLAEPSSGEPVGPLTIAHRYTHQQLAEMIGTYRETVTKLLNNLRDQQIVQMKGGRIQLLDVDRLQKMTST